MKVTHPIRVSDLKQANEFRHYGVLGMKWGVRKDRRGKIKPRSTISTLDRLDSEWLHRTQHPISSDFEKKYDDTFRKTSRKLRKGIRIINSNVKYKGQNFKNDSPLRQQYYNDISKMATQQLNAMASTYGVSSRRRFQMEFNFDVSTMDQPDISIIRRDPKKKIEDNEQKASAELRGLRKQNKIDKANRIKHADNDDIIKVKATYDERGYITDLIFDQTFILHSDGFLSATTFISRILGYDISPAQRFIMQSVSRMEDELYHYGVLGMKWGVRNSRPTQNKSRPTQNKSRPTRYKSRPIPKTRYNRSSTLSNQQLREFTERYRLENEYNRQISQIQKNNRSKGQKFIQDKLQPLGEDILRDVVRSEVQSRIRGVTRPGPVRKQRRKK